MEWPLNSHERRVVQAFRDGEISEAQMVEMIGYLRLCQCAQGFMKVSRKGAPDEIASKLGIDLDWWFELEDEDEDGDEREPRLLADSRF